MKYTIIINQKQALELGIKNINQAIIFDLLTGVSSWADPIVLGDEVFYWVSRQSITRELEILNLKPDTIYRHLKALVELGLVDYEKHGKKDCIRLTEKGKAYYVGNKSEKEQSAEIDPSKNGNGSEKNTETDPTYQDTNNIKQQDNPLAPPAPVFDDFYSLFPKKVGRKDAERSWEKLTPENQQLAINGIKNFVTNKPKQFISAPAVYLNGERWADEVAAVEATNQPPAIRTAAHKAFTPVQKGKAPNKQVAKDAMAQIKKMKRRA